MVYLTWPDFRGNRFSHRTIRTPRAVIQSVSVLICLIGGWKVSLIADDGTAFFESDVRPVLVEHCHKCHGAKKQEAGLRLDSRAAILKGGENGSAVVPGKPDKSLLIRAVRHIGDVTMPPSGKLTVRQIDALAQWVAMGAPWPAGLETSHDQLAATWKTHWAFQPIINPPLPDVRRPERVQTPVDRFVLAKLDAAGLALSPKADRRTLIRRVTYDLTGLPPTAGQVDAFVADDSPDAYATLVDRLLESPQYGEQWARHWLDVARYSDTKGYVYAREERFQVHEIGRAHV